MTKRQHYIEYDYESSFNKSMDELSESDIERRLKNGLIKSIYATKKIYSGDQLELEIYPEFNRKIEVMNCGYVLKSLRAKRKLNDIHSRKQFIRLVNANFKDGDLILTLTYNNGKYPNDYAEAMSNIVNYLRRVNYHRKKQGMPNARYIYVTEWKKKRTGGIRCHHHVIIDSLMNRDELEKHWKLGDRNQSRYLASDEDCLTGLATYLSKDPMGAKRWGASTNLKKPRELKDHCSFRMKQIREMVSDHNRVSEVVMNKVKGYTFREAKVYYNDFNGRYYIYVRMRKRGDEGG